MSTYKDIDLSFIKHPVTGDIPVKLDSNAVKASLQNLIKTKFYERGFNVRVGSNVRDMLFEHFNPVIGQELKKEIETVIANYEPRSEISDVIVHEKESILYVTIKYHILNNASPDVLNIELERLR